MREHQKVIGYAVAERTPEKHELRAIYVLSSHHGKNVGKALMDAALEWLGPERDVLVWVFSHNARAINFYKKHGFTETGKQSTLNVNGKDIPDLEMIRKHQ